ncbi:AI-2E family transporter [uncultured Jannaschia sp.]|uniref:AI-2E family transporter n=1 Tax=uncultured Jannaschia sp. TaxID=293347 RepID=UPI00260C7C0E|nr:AI-2E family transporter [uncultured Jannaschia sp.]
MPPLDPVPPAASSPSASEEAADPAVALLAATRRSNGLMAGILLLLAGGALYSAAAFFMPVVLALLLALTLSPLVRALHRRGLGEGLAAGLVVLALTLGIAGAFGALGTPFFDLVDDAPRMAAEVREKFEELRDPLATVTDMAEQVEGATGGGTGVQQVTVQQPGILSQVAGSALSILTTTVIVVILTLFLLASGDHFSEQIVKSFGSLHDKKRALRTVRDIEGEISRYLLTITAINAGLGVAVGLAMWALDMPTPLLWGVLAAVVNFLPYIGALGGIAIVAVVSLATFETIGAALLPPLAYFACTAIEGQFVTPTVVGRRLRINTVAVFVAVAFWSFLWSIPGALMAVPILVFLKVLCDNVPGLHGLGRFLSAEADDAPEPPASLSVGP